MMRTLLIILSYSLFGCEPKLIVGERNDSGTAGSTSNAGSAGAPGVAGGGNAAGTAGAAGAAGDAGDGDSAGAAGAQCPDTGLPVPGQTDPIIVPWSTGFENGFCDYEAAGGFCLSGGTRSTVTSPTPPFGQFAAEFSVSSADMVSNQARCVRQGVLPKEAYYSAWYYVPVAATLDDMTNSLWNLFHFRGGDASPDGLWDVSLVNGTKGPELLVYDFLKPLVRKQSQPIPIPIGSWFQIQFYLKRASDATGAIRLYQDGALLVEATDIVTDDSSWAQWYVGNIAKLLTPRESTVYVDDVSISTTFK
jgi:hypothetical protein